MSDNVGQSYNEQILQSIIDGSQYVNENPYPSRIEQLLMELKEVIEQGGGATVDQTYTPTSENAQSGKAVAEALETIPSVTVDQTYNAQSANAQSGVAVAEAISAVPKITVNSYLNRNNANSSNPPSNSAITHRSGGKRIAYCTFQANAEAGTTANVSSEPFEHWFGEEKILFALINMNGERYALPMPFIGQNYYNYYFPLFDKSGSFVTSFRFYDSGSIQTLYKLPDYSITINFYWFY